ncbi:MAG: hypothetical protein N2D54_03075, partial [Chloroflexota bacterium]
PNEVTTLSALVSLNLGGNISLAGSAIPVNIGNLTNLQALSMSFNDHSGSIPSSIGSLTKLKELYLQSNNLTGTIPTELGNITTLQKINLNDNLFEGGIPASFGKLTNMTNLYLNENATITGNIPPEMGNATNLKTFQVYNTGLGWTIPTSFSSLAMVNLNYGGTTICLPNSLSSWFSGIGSTDPDPATVFCDPIFTDGFESGDTTAWSSAVGEAFADEYYAEATCKLCVNKAASLIDQKGMKVKVQDKVVHYVQDTSPVAETRYHARFYIDINGLAMNKNNKFELFQGRKGTKKVFFLEVRKFNNKYWLRGQVRKDDGTYKITDWTLLPKTTKAVEIDWKAGAGNGFLKLYVNDVLKVKKLNLDNDTLNVKTVRLGISKKIKAAHNVSGAFFLDQFASDSSTHIGK